MMETYKFHKYIEIYQYIYQKFILEIYIFKYIIWFLKFYIEHIIF
jgi:hypothetical protein